MHSSRMHTARLLTVFRSIRGCWRCLPRRGCLSGGVYLGMHSGQTPPRPREQNHTGRKTLPCPKLRLRAVNIKHVMICFQIKEECILRRYATVMISGGRLKRKFHLDVNCLSRHTPRFVHFVKKLTECNNLRNAVAIDQVFYNFIL